MVQTRLRSRAVFKLNVRSQKAQGIYNNTNNSLTGASGSSAGAIHYATTLPPSNPMPMACPRSHVSMARASKSRYAPGVFKAHLRNVALGRTKALRLGSGKGLGKGRKRSHSRHRRHKRKNGTVMRKRTAYCRRPYHK